MEFHPAANIFPMMTGDDYRALVESIQKNGYDHAFPILTYEGMILDGRNRYTACLEANITPTYAEWCGDDPWEFVWLANSERRHLTQAQKVLIKKRQLEGQTEWIVAKEQRHEEANIARSETQIGISKSEYAERALSNDNARWKRESEQLAQIAGVSQATAARMSALDNARPDLANKVITGEMKPAEAERIRKRDEYAERAPQLPSDKYRIVYADPPWSYGNTQPDYHGVQDDHYPVMPLKEICNIPVIEMIDDNAVLFLWVTSPILEESFQVIKAWGFEYKASFVWDKIKHNMGHYNSVRHEFLLVCVRGSCKPDVLKLFDSVYSEERTEHSKKPEYFRQVIDTIYPNGNRIELFARQKSEGWNVYGNDAKLS